jgi:hypothetical protein
MARTEAAGTRQEPDSHVSSGLSSLSIPAAIEVFRDADFNG